MTKITEKEFNDKFIRAIIQVRHQMDMDKFIYGDSFIEFTERKIEVITPDKVVLKTDNLVNMIDKQKVREVIDKYDDAMLDANDDESLDCCKDSQKKSKILNDLKKELGI